MVERVCSGTSATAMQCLKLLLLFLFVGGSWRHVRCTCVLESEFGFTLNCAFKKSGLFRVRNLGGIKAHVGLGFTVGDELGFSESLSNVENNRRRSTQVNRFQNAIVPQNAQQKTNRINVRQPAQAQPAQAQPAQAQPAQAKPAGVPKQHANGKSAAAVPPFKPIPPAPERPIVDRALLMSALNATKAVRAGSVPPPALAGVAVPAFQAMPSSISRISTGATAAPDKKLSSNNLSLRTLPSPADSALNSLQDNSVQGVGAIANVSAEAVEAAVLYRKQQQLKQQQRYTSTTPRPAVTPRRQTNVHNKVMNAPKEYYPVGYDKNFDDNFSSRVELPDTSFYCGDQKHFPGLYADEDLGCMVFHVCALTDDGLIMKSFLCPESTLFDQTILKCNWWFYVDCKSSKKLYDSNIPVSKSYQLMKALTFFSAYKRDQPPTTAAPAPKA